MLLFVCGWLIHFLQSDGVRGHISIDLPEMSSNPSSEHVVPSCSEMFHLIDTRNCCSIPYLPQPDVVEPCLQTSLSQVTLASKNCRAECVIKRTKILIDGHFQMETAMSQLTNTSSDDSLLTDHIQYAITKCHQNHFNTTVINLPNTCTPDARHLMDCIFAILYRKWPNRYWTATDECRQLVRTLNECSYVLVYCNKF